jgi:transglutaminase-like putative cysteine protease
MLDFERPAPRRSRPRLAPEQGWFALLLLLAMCLALAWSLDDAVLVLGNGAVTDFLTWAAVGGVLIGVLGPTVGWGRWTTHLIGALFAALLVPLLVGWVLVTNAPSPPALFSAGATPHDLFHATTHSAVTAWTDLVVNRRLSTFQYGHHLLVLGLIVWGSSQFASFAAFGHRRPLNAVIVIGLLLLGNMSLTTRDQLPYLVVFSVAALFLLVRFHTFDEQSDWLRRRIGDPSAISGLYLRGGSVFIASAVMGSLLLTNVAASAPLAGAWTDVGARLLEWSRAIERFLPSSGSGRSIGPSFGRNAITNGVWTTNDDPFLKIEIDSSEEDVPYLATVVYDTFDRTGWTRHEPPLVARAANEELLAGTADQIIPEGRRELTVTITPVTPRSEVFTPVMPLSVDQPTGVALIGDGGYFEGIVRETAKSPYTVTALVPASEAEGGPTEAKLRAAGTDYPDEVMALYGPDTVADDALGDASRALLAEIKTRAGATNAVTPYDLAATTANILKDTTRFEYDRDVRDRLGECQDVSSVECFARIKRGYCEYYASTMAVLLREMGVPTRVPYGFLPGRRDLGAGEAIVRNSDSHAWVQVYFPGWGWIDFDPTGTVATLPPLPSGRPDASPTARPSGSTAPVTRRPESADPRDIGGAGTTGGSPTGAAGPLIAASILLAIIVAAIAAVAWQRGPRGPVSAEGTYGSVTRLAARFGFGPRPNQTVYEYAGALAEVLPTVRPELETVARAKVEVAYGGRVLSDDGLRSLREAHRRVRIGLLRLVARRFRRRRGRGPTLRRR